MRQLQRSNPARAEIAALAARALVEGLARDFDGARRRAARELGVEGNRAMPDNLEIHRAMVDYLELFRPQSQRALVRHLRQTARRALVLFEEFEPRLCGPVWYGTVSESTPVSVHLFSDETEAVIRFLLDRGIDFNVGEGSFRFAGEKNARCLPQFEVLLGGEAFDLSVFPTGGRWRNPLSRLDDRALKRVGVRELDEIIEADVLFPDAPVPRVRPRA